MKLKNKTENLRARGAASSTKSEGEGNIHAVALLIFFMIGVSTALQLMFLA